MKILKLEVQAQEYKRKLNESNSIIKTISLNYKVIFETEEQIYHESILPDMNTVYGDVGGLFSLKAAGVAFRFIPLGNNKILVTCNASLNSGDYPYGKNIEILKHVRYVRIFIPFMENRKNLEKFKVHQYEIELGINGRKLDTIHESKSKIFPINTGAYRAEKRRFFGTVIHYFDKPMFNQLKVKEHLQTY